jgi:hypothetical protein
MMLMGLIAASTLGKWKTLLLNIGVATLILHYPPFGLPIPLFGSGDTFCHSYLKAYTVSLPLVKRSSSSPLSSPRPARPRRGAS